MSFKRFNYALARLILMSGKVYRGVMPGLQWDIGIFTVVLCHIHSRIRPGPAGGEGMPPLHHLAVAICAHESPFFCGFRLEFGFFCKKLIFLVIFSGIIV
jgi:hypothetical protein